MSITARAKSWLAENCQELPLHHVGFRNEVDMVSVYNLYRKIKNDKVNVVHCIGHRDLVAASLAKNLPGCPKVTLVKAEHSYPDKNLSPLFRWAYGQCHAVTTVSNALKQALTNAVTLKPVTRIEVVANGIAPLEALPPPPRNPDGPLHIGVLSPLRPGKGQSDFLKALAALKENSNRPWKASLAGDGEERKALEEQAQSLGIEVEFIGHTAEPESYLRSLDLSVVPSRKETFSLVTLESMMCGLPIIAADSEGVAEICEGHPGAILYKAGESDALSEALLRFLETPEKLTQAAYDNLSQIRERFSSETMADNYLRLYRELLQ